MIQAAFSSLLRFAHKTSKNRRLGDFLPLKLREQPLNRGFCGTKRRKNLQVQQAARSLPHSRIFARRASPFTQKSRLMRLHVCAATEWLSRFR
jgi:hypothetical protein